VKKRLDIPENPDIELAAVVKARKLRFRKVPETEVRFSGHAERESVSGTERENLPENVEPDITYRNPRVRLRIATRLADTGSQDEQQRNDASKPQRRRAK
jgi:hypothetical protein